MPAENAVAVAAELERLFIKHGPPLVQKSDNGAPLITAPIQAVLEKYGVTLLRSPTYTPRFNGSCERSLGWTKVHAMEFMRARGAPCLERQDLDAARDLQNASGSPRHLKGMTPEQVWSARTAVGEAERRAFIEAREEALVKEEKRAEEAGEVATDLRCQARIQRAATCRVLCDRDYLKIRRP